MPAFDVPDQTEPRIERAAARVVLLDPEGRLAELLRPLLAGVVPPEPVDAGT